MKTADQLLRSLQSSVSGLSLTELLALHPDVPRRTAQRQLSRLVDEQKIVAAGQARARRYHAAPDIDASASKSADDDFSYADGRYMIASREHNRELIYKVIPLSPDSRDILTYIDQPLLARKPVGYQPEFLNAYEPNKTWYLPEPLRRQLKKMGDTGQGGLPAGTYGHAILNRLLIDLSWASSHLEGNTYTRLDTRELIEHGTAAQGKAALETQMILNHKAAIELLVENADSVDFNRFTILNLHSALSENLLPNPADEGRVRQHVVEISQSVYRPLSVPAQIDEALDMLLDKASQIEDPFEQSFFVMVHVPYLQPFADINKRVSRLAANLPLIRANLCPLTFLDVPEKAYSSAILGVYEMTRIELLRDLYVWAYERSTQEYLALKQELAEPDPLRLAYRTLIKQTIHDIVVRPDDDALAIIEQSAALHAAKSDRMNVQALIVEELRRLHEGVLARYGLRPSEFSRWREKMAGK